MLRKKIISGYIAGKNLILILVITVLIINNNVLAQVQDNTPKKALIFGVTGQDGSYLAEFY